MSSRGTSRSGTTWTMTGGFAGTPQTWRISGIESVAKNINVALMKIKGKSAVGLNKAAKYVLDDADITSPSVPQDTGDLRKSTFTESKTKAITKDPYVVLGYKTNYAAAVHEMMVSPSGKPINWKRPGSGPKFLEASLKRNGDEVARIVAEYVKL